MRLNPILRQHFSGLYEKVLVSLQQLLNAPVRLENKIAFPGFHIFLPHPAFEIPLMSVHYDLQFELIPWEQLGFQVDEATHLSFTLAVALPRFGGGLNLWDLDYESRSAIEGGIQKYASTHTPQKIEYQSGELFLHSGYRLHQIAASEKLSHDDVRITLQGHAICDENGWILYW